MAIAVSIAMLVRAVEMDGCPIEFTALSSANDEDHDDDDFEYDALEASGGCH